MHGKTADTVRLRVEGVPGCFWSILVVGQWSGLTSKHAVHVEGIAQNDRERDHRPPENKLQRLRGCRRLPKR